MINYQNEHLCSLFVVTFLRDCCRVKRRKGSSDMFFNRSNQQQAQTPQGGQAAGGFGNNDYRGQANASGAQAGTPWQTAGGTPLAGSYPSQQAGTGYAGYTPGVAENPYGQFQAGYGQNGYGLNNGQGGNGYSQPGPGYSQTAYPQAGAGYGQNPQSAAGGYPQAGMQAGNAYGQTAGGYAQQGGYAAGTQGTGYAPGGYPQMNPQGGTGYNSAGGYPQMNGYAPGGSGNGYTYPQNGGYAGYQQGQPYAQMGRNQQPPAQQIPLNGGGYVPQHVPVKKAPFVFNDGLLILLSAVMLALFAVGLFVPAARALLWVFLVLSAASIVLFWVRPMIDRNKRLSFTIIFGALSLVAALTVLGLLGGRTAGGSGGEPSGTRAAAQETASPVSAGAVIDPETGAVISSVSQVQETPTPTPAPNDNATTDRVEAFFQYWGSNMQDEMLNLCAPSWQSTVENPKTSLFYLLANRKPLDHYVEKVSGTSEDTSRTVTVTSTMDRNNGKEPVKYRLSVLMVNEGGTWYVDPQSLKTYEEAETPDPAAAATPTPSPEPAANANTVLYYNPDGGTKYHLDQNCKSTHAKYLPMKGHFTYSEINDEKYAKLQPCNVCAAPLR